MPIKINFLGQKSFPYTRGAERILGIGKLVQRYLDENYKNSINDKIGVKEYLGHSNSILNSIAQLVQKVKSG